MNVCHFFVIILLGILSVCCHQRQYNHLLDKAEQLARTIPGEAIRFINTSDSTALNRYTQKALQYNKTPVFQIKCCFICVTLT